MALTADTFFSSQFRGYSGFSGTSGASGTSGTSGFSGISGYSGTSGTSGFSGISGYSGTSGTSGFSGYSGTSGTSGFSGSTGTSGTSGFSGISGYSGTSGTSGFSGISGYSGTSGTSGFSGYSGTSGTSGFSGSTGTSGTSGFSGISGYSGTSGTSGFSGSTASVTLASISGALGYTPATTISPTFTGTPSAPTATSGTNTTQIATTAFVRTEVTNLVASAPSTLDTLKELATALGNDASFSTTISTALGLKAPLASPTFTGTVSGITKAMVGLGNVDNTADANKSVSYATTAGGVAWSGITSKPTTLSGYGITDAYSSSNPSGYISGITSSQVTTALGYTPYNSTNPSGFITGESDTLATVTARGASTSTQSAFNGGLTSSGYTNIGGHVYISGTNNNTLNSGYATAADGSDLWVNYRGYNDGQSYYRNFNIGDGRGNNVAWADGPNKRLSINNGQAASYTLHVNGIGYSSSSFHAPIFYDSDNTSYYCDPNGTSNLSGPLTIGGWTALHKGNYPESVASGSITGSFSANTWNTYLTWNGQGTGTFIIQFLVMTWNGGGSNYTELYSMLFSTGQEFTNSGASETLSATRGGHAPNTEVFSFLYQRNGASYATLKWMSNMSLTLDGSGGKTVLWKISRIASNLI